MDNELKSPIFKENYDKHDEEEKTTIYKWYQINVDILPAKFAYFFEYVRLVSYMPNLVLFLTGIGLSKTESGIIMGFRSIGQLIGGPFWGIVADKLNCHKLVVVLMCIFSLTAMCSQVLVSFYHGDPNINTCPASIASQNNINKTTPSLFNYSTARNNTINSGFLTKPTTETSRVYLFWIIFVLQIALSFSESNSAFIDAATIRKSQLSTNRKVEYGPQRMFGAVGGTAGVVVGNLAVFNSPISGVTCYAGFVIPYVLFAIATAVALEFLYKGLNFKKQESKANSKFTTTKNEFKKILIKTLLQKEVLLFFGIVFFAGLIDTPNRYLYLYLKELNSPEALYTVSLCTGGLTSIIGYYFSKEMINFFGSTWKALAVAFIAYGLRHLGYSLVKNPWLIVLSELLHTFSFCLFVTTGITHVKKISSAPIMTTMASIFNALFFAVGPMVGLPLCGMVYENYGSRALFKGASMLEFSFAVVIGVLAVFVLKKKKNINQNVYEQQNEDCLLAST